METPVPTSDFAFTRWSIVLAAGDRRAGTAARRAMGELAGQYWFPLYSFIRRKGHDAAEAEDLTQRFFTHLLEKNALARVDRELGKFRSFLLACLQNYLADERDKAHRAKRGGGRKAVALDGLDAEARYKLGPIDTMTPERLFAHRWALTVLNQVMARLKAEYEERGKGLLFEALQGAIAGSAEALGYGAAGERLGMTEAAVKMAAHRLRRRYRELLRDEIAQTVASPELIDEEIRFLMESL